jgi:CRISPR-associated protein Csb2
MSAVRCQFLLGTYQASDPLVGFGKAEWPPHPARLHAALVAAAWALGDGTNPRPDALAALRELERTPPSLVLPAAATRTPATAYVWQNPKRTVRRRGERQFPAVVVGDNPVWFRFDLEPTPPVLRELAEAIAFVGSSRSPVCCDVVDELPPLDGIELVPANGGPRTLRVARPGFTDELVEHRFEFPPVAFGAMQAYTRKEGEAPVLGHGPFSELLVARFVDAFPLTLHHAALVTGALRQAVLAQAGDSAPAVLHGHGCNPHTAFLALPDVGHKHATGALRGVAIALPGAIESADRDAAVAAFRAVRRLRVDRRLAPVRLEPGGELRSLAPSRWIGPARIWRSVTPIVVDRHPKPASGGVEGALRVAAANALLPETIRIEANAVPFLAGVPLARGFRGEIPRGMRVHVELEFAEPVRGPILVGRGRYLGIGLLAPAGGAG